MKYFYTKNDEGTEVKIYENGHVYINKNNSGFKLCIRYESPNEMVCSKVKLLKLSGYTVIEKEE